MLLYNLSKRGDVVLLNFDLSCVTRVCCLVFRHAHYRNSGEELNMAVSKTHARCCLLNDSTDHTFKLIEMKRSLSFKIIAAGVEAMDVNIQPSI